MGVAGDKPSISEAELSAAEIYADFARLYYDNRLDFVRNVYGIEPAPWQGKVLGALDIGIANRTSIRSGHGVGKTTLLAWICIHFMLTRTPGKCVCTAPTQTQLFDALMSEIKVWIGKLPEGLRLLLDKSGDRVWLKSDPDASFLTARTSRAETPEALQGVHSDNVLLIVDEASGVPEPIYESASGSMSTPNSIMILASNPTRVSGYFFNTQTKWARDWFTMKVSTTDVDGKWVDKKFAKEIADKWGLDSMQYAVRVLGEFPTSEARTFIPVDLVESAYLRHIEVDINNVKAVWGLDVARYGPNKSVLTKRFGNVILDKQRVWHKIDTNLLTQEVYGEWLLTPEREKPAAICIDGIGVGGGVADNLFALGLPAVAINVTENLASGIREPGKMLPAKLRDQLWLYCRDWLATRLVKMPMDDELKDELTTITYKLNPKTGKLEMETKDSMESRDLPSPDRADSLCLTFAWAAAMSADATKLGSQDWQRFISRHYAGGSHIL